MQPRRARSIRPSTVGWLALIIGTTLSACVLFAFAAVIFGADCGRSLGSTVCSDEVRPRLAQSATMLSAVFLAIGSAIAVAALATILVGKHRNKLQHISVGAVGLGITSAVVVMFSLGVLVAPGDQPRLPYIYFAGGMWIIVSAGFLVTGLIAAVQRERRVYSADGHAP